MTKNILTKLSKLEAELEASLEDASMLGITSFSMQKFNVVENKIKKYVLSLYGKVGTAEYNNLLIRFGFHYELKS